MSSQSSESRSFASVFEDHEAEISWAEALRARVERVPLLICHCVHECLNRPYEASQCPIRFIQIAYTFPPQLNEAGNGICGHSQLKHKDRLDAFKKQHPFGRAIEYLFKPSKREQIYELISAFSKRMYQIDRGFHSAYRSEDQSQLVRWQSEQVKARDMAEKFKQELLFCLDRKIQRPRKVEALQPNTTADSSTLPASLIV